MITFGRPEYIKGLKLLWKNNFGDKENFLDSFFENVYVEKNTLLCIEDGLIVSALYIIPYKMLLNGREENIAYFYALSTNPDYRGRGIMSELISLSLELCKKRNYALSVLIPARDSLSSYYKKFGFEYSFYQIKITLAYDDIKKAADSTTPVKLIKADAFKIWNLYSKSSFYTSGCIILNEAQNKFYIDEISKLGGEALVIKIGDMHYYAILKSDRGNLLILETDLNETVINAFYSSLIEKYKFKTVTFFQPLCFSEELNKQNIRPYAMSKKLKNLNFEKPFLNRVLT